MKQRNEAAKTTKTIRSRNLDIIAASVIGILAIGCFVLQGLSTSPTSSKVETALFNILQFLLTVGFTWFGSRVITRSDFEANMKTFAISAYRRVIDVENVLLRLIVEIRRLGLSDKSPSSSEFTLLEALANDGVQIVRSSISDWADIIGKELLAIQSISELQKKQRKLIDPIMQQKSEGYEKMRIDLQNQIDSLREKLPAQLAVSTSVVNEDELNLLHAATWLSEKYEIENGLDFRVVSGGNYPHDREAIDLKEGECLMAFEDQEGGLNIADVEGKNIGRILNNTPLDYPVFVRAMKMCFGEKPIAIKMMKIIHEKSTEKGKMYWFDIHVTAKPIIGPDYYDNINQLGIGVGV